MLKAYFQDLAEWRFCVGQVVGPARALSILEQIQDEGQSSVHYIKKEKAELLQKTCERFGLTVKVSNSGITSTYLDVDIFLPGSTQPFLIKG